MRKGIFCAIAICFLLTSSIALAESFTGNEAADRRYQKMMSIKKMKLRKGAMKFHKQMKNMHRKLKRVYCSADLNMDGQVNESDVKFFSYCTGAGIVGKANIGLCKFADLSNDEKVDIKDLALFAAQLEDPNGKNCGDRLGPIIVGQAAID